MKPLDELVSNLSISELRAVRRKLSAQSRSKKGHMESLLASISNGSVRNPIRSLPTYSQSRIRVQLFDEILDSLVGHSPELNPGDRTSMVIHCDQTILKAKILVSKGLHGSAGKLLRNIRQRAGELELYPQCVIIDQMLGNHGLNGPGNPNEETLLDGIDMYRRMTYADQCFAQVQRHYADPVAYPKFTIDYSGVDALGRCAHATGSVKIAYQYYLLAMNKESHEGNALYAIEFADALRRLFNQKPASLRCLDVTTGLLEAATTYMKSGKVDEALECVEYSLDCCKEQSIEELRSLDKLFLTNLHWGSYQMAEDLITRAANHRHINFDGYQASKWKYYKAALAFKQEEFKLASQLLRECTGFTDDHAEWYLGCHFLELVIYISREDYDMTEIKFNALKQMVNRKKKTYRSPAFHRLDKSLKIIRGLITSNYDFNATYEKFQSQIMLLQESRKMNEWHPYGYEIIRFDTWFLGHVDRAPEKHIWH